MSKIEIGKPLLGFVICKGMADGQFIGGVLVTDAVGLPVEFRHTEPVAPSRLQCILYGRVLNSYMANEVVMSALLGSVEATPQIYVVGDAAYLQGADEYGPSAIWLSEARNVPVKEIGARHELSDEEFVLQLGPGNGPVRVRLFSKGDRASFSEQRDFVAETLLGASGTMEVVEPLQRVDEALDLLWNLEEQVLSSPKIVKSVTGKLAA